MNSPTQMFKEASEAPTRVAHQLAANAAAVSELAGELRANACEAMLTLARGSSDHAASFFAYNAMAASKRVITSIPSSLVNLFQAPSGGPNTWAFAFSQSGQSPDLVAAMAHFANAGSPTVAWVNDLKSPLATGARWALDLHAGPETSVAATKSYLAQLVAGLHLQALWQQDDHLADALSALPQTMNRALTENWSKALDRLARVHQLYVLGRGSAWPLAMEVALKFKETCGIHAEAFSSAEVVHGPMALVQPGFAVLVIAPRGPGQADALAVSKALRERGAAVLVAASGNVSGVASDLTIVESRHPLLDGICAMQSFYVMVEALARLRGLNPDEPAHLSKVTRTH